jgi:hypothetical protein
MDNSLLYIYIREKISYFGFRIPHFWKGSNECEFRNVVDPPLEDEMPNES